METSKANTHFHNLRTIVYYAPDLDKAKSWYSSILGIEPYFDQPFYIGFNVGGYELALDPDASSTPGGNAGAVTYWGVADAQTAFDRLISLGAIETVQEWKTLATVFELLLFSTRSVTSSASLKIRISICRMNKSNVLYSKDSRTI